MAGEDEVRQGPGAVEAVGPFPGNLRLSQSPQGGWTGDKNSYPVSVHWSWGVLPRTSCLLGLLLKQNWVLGLVAPGDG